MIINGGCDEVENDREDGDMLNADSGDSLGWSHTDVSRWVKLSDVLAALERG
jgi:hypothetical protein